VNGVGFYQSQQVGLQISRGESVSIQLKESGSGKVTFFTSWPVSTARAAEFGAAGDEHHVRPNKRLELTEGAVNKHGWRESK